MSPGDMVSAGFTVPNDMSGLWGRVPSHASSILLFDDAAVEMIVMLLLLLLWLFLLKLGLLEWLELCGFSPM